MEFASVFSALRRENGYSQRKVANDLNISQALLSHYENGVREPRLDFIIKACKYYGVSTDYMLGVSQTKENPYTTGQGGGMQPDQTETDGYWGRESVSQMLSSMALCLNTLRTFGGDEAVYYAEEYLATSVGVLLSQMEESLCSGAVTAAQRLELQTALNTALYRLVRSIDALSGPEGAQVSSNTAEAIKENFIRLHDRAAAIK